jgi:hypothetical protein
MGTDPPLHGGARPDSVGCVASNEGLVSGSDALRRHGNAETGAPPTIGSATVRDAEISAGEWPAGDQSGPALRRVSRLQALAGCCRR